MLKMNNFIFKKNKKGALSIFILVALTLVVCGFSLFIFLANPPKVQAVLQGIGNFDELYSSELELNFYLQEIAELSLAQTYNEFIENGNYLSNLRISQAKDLEGIYYIGGISNNFEKDFKEAFKNNFKENFLKINFHRDDSDYIKELQKQIEKENFEVLFDKSSIIVLIKSFNFSYEDNKMQINYTSDLRNEIIFKRFGLEGFEKIVDFGNICFEYSNISQKIDCYEENKDYFDNFYFYIERVILSEGEEEIFLRFQTKRDFFIDKEFKKIKFKFIPV